MLIIIKLEQASRRILEVCFEFSAAMLRKACFNLYARTFAGAKFASGPSRGGAARPKVGPASLDDKKAAKRLQVAIGAAVPCHMYTETARQWLSVQLQNCSTARNAKEASLDMSTPDLQQEDRHHPNS